MAAVRAITSTAALLCVLLAAGCTVGTGEVAPEARDVGAFDAVVLETSGSVELTAGGRGAVEIEAQETILPLLTTEVVDGALRLGADGSFSTSRGITYRITTDELTAVTIAGSGDMDVTGLDGDVFDATISGSGTVQADGAVAELVVTISGAGDFAGEDLAARRADVTVSGSGDAVVDVAEDLRARVSGSGDVRYTGQPAVDAVVTGSGDVGPR